NHSFEKLCREGVQWALSRRRSGDPQFPAENSGFTPQNIAWRKLTSFGISRCGVARFQGFDLRRSEAGIGLRPAAKQNRRIKAAAARRVVNETIFQTVRRVARSERGSFNSFHLLSRDI